MVTAAAQVAAVCLFGGPSERPSVRGGIPRIRPLVVEQRKPLVRNHRIEGRPMRRKNPLVGVRLPETRPTCDGSATWPFVVNVEDASRPALDLSGLVGAWSLVGAHFIGKPPAREATVTVHGSLYPGSRGEILHAMKHDAQSESDRDVAVLLARLESTQRRPFTTVRRAFPFDRK